jgi:D-alanyl-D-alanine carboxypeptidase
VRRLNSTDRLLGRDDIVIETAKTGYTDTARYCFTTVLDTENGRRLGITLLGADGKMTRWADVGRILDWANRTENAGNAGLAEAAGPATGAPAKAAATKSTHKSSKKKSRRHGKRRK